MEMSQDGKGRRALEKGHIFSNLFARGWRNCTDVTGQLEGYLSTNCRQRLWAGCMLCWLCIPLLQHAHRLDSYNVPMVYALWWVVVTTQQISQSWCEERKAEEDDSERSGESAYGETRSRWLFNCNCGNLRQNCKLAEAVLWRLRLQAAVHWPSASDLK